MSSWDIQCRGPRRAALALAALATALAGVGEAVADSLSLDRFLVRVRETHPYFHGEALRAEVEQERRNRFLGDEEWMLSVEPAFAHDELAPRSFAAPDEVDSFRVRATARRKLWRTGGRLEVAYDYGQTEQVVPNGQIPVGDGTTIDVSGPSKFFENAASVSYVQPLLLNRGGALDRLAFDVQSDRAELATVQALENQERVLLAAGAAYLTWLQSRETDRIAAERVRFAEDQLVQAQRNHEANLVEEVDVLRAQAAVLETRRAQASAGSARKAQAIEVASFGGFGAADRLPKPSDDLYVRQVLDPLETVLAMALRDARVLAANRLRLQALDREQDALVQRADPILDLVLSGGLKDGDERAGDASDFDRPNLGVALSYAYTLGNSTALSDVRRIRLERMAAEADIAHARRDIESVVRQLHVRLTDMAEVLELSREQVAVAQAKTEAETQLYEQGRNELTFVIQSQDSEAIARLAYARNAAEYQRMHLSLREATDRLIPTPAVDAE